MALVLWRYDNPYVEPEKMDVRNFTFCGKFVQVHQDPSKKITLHSNTSHRLWDGSYVLARFIEQAHLKVQLEDKKVLEVGSGTGLTGLVAWLQGGHVTLTDLPEVVAQTAHNVESNANHWASIKDVICPDGQLQVCVLPWGTTSIVPHWSWKGDGQYSAHEGSAADNSHGATMFDIILGADVTYLPDSLPDLLHTIRAFCHTHTVVYLAHKARGLVDDVLAGAIAAAGFTVTEDKQFGCDLGYSILTLRPTVP